MSDIKLRLSEDMYGEDEPVVKYAVSFWCNLKGNYDLVIFDNEKDANDYANTYKEAYNEWLNGNYADDNEAVAEAESILQPVLDMVNGRDDVEIETELYGRDFKDDKWDMYGDGSVIVEIVAECDYGY